MDEKPDPTPPKRFWRVTFWTPDGTERRRYIRCPYLEPSSDSLVNVTARLGELVWTGILESYRISPVPSARVAAVRNRSVRWSEVEASLLAA
jgi:hypothetical protein